MYEIISIVANLGALAVIGVIYVAYIKNLRSVVGLKDAQLQIAEQNVKLWKDKAIELERRSPEFVEKQLNERIKIREEEIKRLSLDGEEHIERIALKNSEVEALRENLERANQFFSSFTVWDKDRSDFIEVPHTELELNVVGSICVDTATLMVCDPYYLKSISEVDVGCEVQKFMFQVVDTGEVFCTNFGDVSLDLELLGIDDDLSWDQLVDQGKLKRLDYSGEFPAVPSTYIRGDLHGNIYKQINHFSFLNGRLGAGISISLGADGIYPVSVESYKGELKRIIIDV